MAQDKDRTRLIVRKTIEQLKGELGAMVKDSPYSPLEILNKFEARLDFNMYLAQVPRFTGRKPKPKSKTFVDDKKD